MGFRFWRRIKIAPGVTLNLSKSGGSLSFGPRGAKFTVGSVVSEPQWVFRERDSFTPRLFQAEGQVAEEICLPMYRHFLQSARKTA